MGITVLDKDFGSIRTIMVFGAGRGGTSVAAGCLRLMGVKMGLAPHPVKHEWSPIVYDGSRVMVDATLVNIRQMNETNELWGWKSPADIYCIEQYIHYLRSPALLLVTRDVIDVAQSSARQEKLPIKIGLYETAMVYSHIFDRIRFLPFPKIIVSYEYILANSKAFAETLAGMLGITVSAATATAINGFSSPTNATYRTIDGTPTLHSGISAEDLESDAQRTVRRLITVRTPELRRQIHDMAADSDRTIEICLADTSSHMAKSMSLEDMAPDLQQIAVLVRSLGDGATTADIVSAAFLDGRIHFDKFHRWIASCIVTIRRLADATLSRLETGTHSAEDAYLLLNTADRHFLIMIRIRMALQKLVESLSERTANA